MKTRTNEEVRPHYTPTSRVHIPADWCGAERAGGGGRSSLPLPFPLPLCRSNTPSTERGGKKRCAGDVQSLSESELESSELESSPDDESDDELSEEEAAAVAFFAALGPLPPP